MSNVIPKFNPNDLLILYINGQYDELCDKFISVLEYFEKNSYLTLRNEVKYFIDVFIKNFLYLFTQPEFYLQDRYIIRFIQFNPLISNLVALTSLKNTDYYLEILENQAYNFAKILTLYSPRNKVSFDYNLFFDAHPKFACLWYSSYLKNYNSVMINQNGKENLKKHLNYNHPQLTEFYDLAQIFFASTFIDPELDSKIKIKINLSIQKNFLINQGQIKHNPQKNKIAFITSCWQKENPVYKRLYPYIASLLPEYELTLIQLKNPHQNSDLSLFKDVIYLQQKEGKLNLEEIENNQFMVALFPEVGITADSVLLSNLKIAPIQICALGHPVSTYGLNIDYFLSGERVETSLQPQKYYAEKLVLLPGFGIINQSKDYLNSNLINNQVKPNQEKFIINCVWDYLTINHENLIVLSDVIKQSEKKILFRFILSDNKSLLKDNNYLVFLTEIETFLEQYLGKDNYQIIPFKSDHEYRDLISQGNISLDSYPFSNFTEIIHSLTFHQPVVTWQGEKWYNRISSEMVKMLGLKELITTNPQEYINLTLKLIGDDLYREKIINHLKNTNFNTTIFDDSSQIYFKIAIDYLIDNHDTIQQENNNKPIIIEKYSWLEISS
jgi:predicted O-linked N-acetylglucosamine transferase (SPINDLY family)